MVHDLHGHLHCGCYDQRAGRNSQLNSSPEDSPASGMGLTELCSSEGQAYSREALCVSNHQPFHPEQVHSTEWSIHPRVLLAIKDVWTLPMVDLFATKLIHKLPVYVSPIPDPAALAVDAITLDWSNMVVFAYQPTALVSQVLNEVLESENQVLLVAPCWPHQPWFPQLLDLLIDHPREFPKCCFRTLLKQPRTNIYHENPARLRLHVWPLSRNPSRRKDFLDRCPRLCPSLSDLPPWRFMMQVASLGSLV